MRDDGVEEGVLLDLLVNEQAHRHQVGEEAKAENDFGNEEQSSRDVHEHVRGDGVHIEQPEKEQASDEE